jgi:hypothetical protein
MGGQKIGQKACQNVKEKMQKLCLTKWSDVVFYGLGKLRTTQLSLFVLWVVPRVRHASGRQPRPSNLLKTKTLSLTGLL